MHKFVDETLLRVKAGNGGPGCIAFAHIKFNEYGGPDGGDGGQGGNVYIQGSHKILSLAHLNRRRKYHAENGHGGSGRKRSGSAGEDLIIRVPLGCQVIDAETDELMFDIENEEPHLIEKGGRGGKGNAFFATSTQQAPRFAQPGEATEEKTLLLSLKLIADVGLVGFPNAGKSTLLAALTHAKPKIANYPFTTLSPNLGVLILEHRKQVLIADIPGILEGASQGVGLGLSFLKHIERVKVIIYVLDITTTDVAQEMEILKSELTQYNPQLLKRPSITVFNKTDLVEDPEFVKEWIKSFKKLKINAIPISAATGEGLKELTTEIGRLLG